MIQVAEHWFESEGLYAVERGHGRPIVFLHGGLADHRAAVHAVGQLGASFQLITPDLRGSGRSIDAGPLTWDRLADGVAIVLERLGLERVVIGGSSAGSAVALRFALRRPELCAGLVLASPLYPGAELGLDEAPRLAMQAMDAHAQRALVDGVEALFPLFERLPAALRERALATVASFDLASVAATTRLLASGQQPFASLAELQRIELPTLVVPGEDPQHPAAVASLYAAHIPGCRIGTLAQLPEAIARFCSEAARW